jgi:hypothetical protein
MTQARRCLIAHDGMASMSELREWCYAGQPRQHWFYINIKRALRRLGAQSLGRAGRKKGNLWTVAIQEALK